MESLTTKNESLLKQNEFLHYCPTCKNYDDSTGVCCFIHENVLEYNHKFTKLCGGKYFTLDPEKTGVKLIESISRVAEYKKQDYRIVSGLFWIIAGILLTLSTFQIGSIRIFFWGMVLYGVIKLFKIRGNSKCAIEDT
jgi:hypothetical protein